MYIYIYIYILHIYIYRYISHILQIYNTDGLRNNYGMRLKVLCLRNQEYI